MISEQDWKIVTEDEDWYIREWFVNLIELGNLSKYVNKIYYKDVPVISKLMRIEYEEDLNKRGVKQDIIIFPNAFSKKAHETLDDFLGSLFNHEGFHAKELPKKYSEKAIYNSEIELRAYRNEVKYFNKGNFSNTYKRAIIKEIKRHKDRIEKAKKI